MRDEVLVFFFKMRGNGDVDLLGADMMGRRTLNAAVKGVFHSRLFFILVSLIVIVAAILLFLLIMCTS